MKELLRSENLKLWDRVKKVPEKAKKSITAGRLKGFTDINPVWRLMTLTAEFGQCGIGWYYEIVDKQIIEGADGNYVCSMTINLFVNVNGEWSKPIQGIGGSSFIATEKSGKYTSDECFKMALTDAISVCCKALGIGSEVYFSQNDSKYQTIKEDENKRAIEESGNIQDLKITPKQIAVLQQIYKGENMNKLLEMNGIDNLEDMTMVKASDIIKRLRSKQ